MLGFHTTNTTCNLWWNSLHYLQFQTHVSFLDYELQKKQLLLLPVAAACYYLLNKSRISYYLSGYFFFYFQVNFPLPRGIPTQCWHPSILGPWSSSLLKLTVSIPLVSMSTFVQIIPKVYPAQNSPLRLNPRTHHLLNASNTCSRQKSGTFPW